ncbi:hypothetical protein MKD50_27400 [Cupriavidus sp. WGtm5]|uniref:hypothetical protein n=1 Tax=Cupriavidus sp. WGtm5 TaxID=2919926 RepID=UPI0020912C13|nr:hypothetical protein [Cupriavidus sp. WGtm5]MCO4893125.1 hypothetical protein [Cupriavidus sp. WGtm5]
MLDTTAVQAVIGGGVRPFIVEQKLRGSGFPLPAARCGNQGRPARGNKSSDRPTCHDKELAMKPGSSGKTAGKTSGKTSGKTAGKAGADRKNPGARMDREASEIKSRSADPGQSSYGGFRNEDPRRQHQAESGKPKKPAR